MTASGFVQGTERAAFTPRGANFVRLAATPGGGHYHSTFEPGAYDATAAKQALGAMKHDGYNLVRVFIDPGTFTAPFHGNSASVESREPVRAEYMDNVAKFVKEAGAQGIYVLPSLDYIPANTYYYAIAGSPKGNIDGDNTKYLDKDYVKAKAEYMAQFAKALIARVGPQYKNAVLAYASDNEAFFDGSKAPYATMSGTVTTLDGKTYDMSKPADRQQSADANLVAYTHQMKQALKSVDSDLLLTMGFFTNGAVGKPGFDGLTVHCSHSCNPNVDYRVPGRPLMVAKHGALDFVDLHLYPRSRGYDLAADMQTMEGGRFDKPLLIGEMGALKSIYGNDITAAAYAMRDLQVATCAYAAKGWAFWTWDTTEDLAEQRRFYNLRDNSGAINGQLAPIVRFDPCKKEPTSPPPAPTASPTSPPTATATATPTGTPTASPTTAPTTAPTESSTGSPEASSSAPVIPKPNDQSGPPLADTGGSSRLPLLLGVGITLALLGAAGAVFMQMRRKKLQIAG
ncbi:cellulase family glycosylhydrolase (plasmid) [Streptomycetaceae bacterium NBC_01309]